jgi:Protein of unknown function (DUF5661)
MQFISYASFLMEDSDLKPVPTPQAIARKHNVPLERIMDQLYKGIEVEKEHTNKVGVARKIALAHLIELPNYYDQLKKMEGTS